jgi:hypothetical protein
MNVREDYDKSQASLFSERLITDAKNLWPLGGVKVTATSIAFILFDSSLRKPLQSLNHLSILQEAC